MRPACGKARASVAAGDPAVQLLTESKEFSRQRSAHFTEVVRQHIDLSEMRPAIPAI